MGREEEESRVFFWGGNGRLKENSEEGGMGGDLRGGSVVGLFEKKVKVEI